jgi:hypothetical protein
MFFTNGGIFGGINPIFNINMPIYQGIKFLIQLRPPVPNLVEVHM